MDIDFLIGSKGPFASLGSLYLIFVWGLKPMMSISCSRFSYVKLTFTESNCLASTDFCSNSDPKHSRARLSGSSKKSNSSYFLSCLILLYYVEKSFLFVFCSLKSPSDGQISSKMLSLLTIPSSGDSSIYSSITLWIFLFCSGSLEVSRGIISEYALRRLNRLRSFRIAE